jgi:peptidyl-prolyl cis-trans isomerase B (cyclophilin B)
MHSAISVISILFSVLVPQKMWYAPQQAVSVTVASKQDVTLEMTDFSGKLMKSKSSTDAKAGATVDLLEMFPALEEEGTFVVYALPRGTPLASGVPKDFLGVPLVIELRMQDDRLAVRRVAPLQYAVMRTDAGPMTVVFYYDAAPHTVDSFLALASEGYYDGLVFHRVVPGFVIQGGDPMGTGMGGPGYHVEAEFNGKPHTEGVLSMARSGDPNEDPSMGIWPRSQYANSAGSQFFICLDYKQTAALDRHYTAFAKVVQGMEAVRKIENSPIADPQRGTPKEPTTIQKVEVFGVTAADNPYQLLSAPAAPAAASPATRP